MGDSEVHMIKDKIRLFEYDTSYDWMNRNVSQLLYCYTHDKYLVNFSLAVGYILISQKLHGNCQSLAINVVSCCSAMMSSSGELFDFWFLSFL